MEPLIKRQSLELIAGHRAAIQRPVQVKKSYAHSVSGGAGGHGTKISHPTLAGSSFGHEYTGYLAIANDKATMQHLNDRLASYLETVRNLEKANGKLEIQIREYIEKKGPSKQRDYSKYFDTIEDLRAKVRRGLTQC